MKSPTKAKVLNYKGSPKVVKTVTVSPKIKRKSGGNICQEDLRMLKKYEGADEMPVAVEEVADDEIYKQPMMRNKKNPNSLISPASAQMMDKYRTIGANMHSGRQYNNSTINDYRTAPTKKVISTINKKSKQGSIVESSNSKNAVQKNKFSAT